MGRGAIGDRSREPFICYISGVMMEKECKPMDCDNCGWNPEVNKRRRQAIRWYARNKILNLWGIEKDMENRSEMGRKAIKYIKMELARIVTEESK